MDVNMNDIKHTFVLKDGAWWLKITTPGELLKYHEETTGRWEDGFNSLVESKEFTKHGLRHASSIAYAIGMYGSRNNMNPIEATTSFRRLIMENQLRDLMNGDVILINENGAYHTEQDGLRHEQYIIKNDLVFPGFKKEEIRVKRFEGGEHFYAYIGNMQVRDGDTVKWNTYEEAYNKALNIVHKQ